MTAIGTCPWQNSTDSLQLLPWRLLVSINPALPWQRRRRYDIGAACGMARRYLGVGHNVGGLRTHGVRVHVSKAIAHLKFYYPHLRTK